MQTSAMNWSLLLNADKLEKSPVNFIVRAALAISFSSFSIALCQCNMLSTGCFGDEVMALLSDRRRSLLAIQEDEWEKSPFSFGLTEAQESLWSSAQRLCLFLIFTPSIQLKIIFIKDKNATQKTHSRRKMLYVAFQSRCLTCWSSVSSGIILCKHLRISCRSSGEIDDASHGKNSAIIFTGMLHKNCQTNDACSSNENFSLSKGNTC